MTVVVMFYVKMQPVYNVKAQKHVPTMVMSCCTSCIHDIQSYDWVSNGLLMYSLDSMVEKMLDGQITLITMANMLQTCTIAEWMVAQSLMRLQRLYHWYYQSFVHLL